MTTLLHLLQSLLIVATGVGLVVLAWIWSPFAGAAAAAAAAVALYAGIRRGFFTPPASQRERSEGTSTEAEARTLVTQMLKILTRVQVAYLCQDFENPDQARSWLRRALPRSFHSLLEELQQNLQRARQGEEVPAVRLAQRIASKKERLLELEQALQRAKDCNPDFCIAHPLIFVVTEGLGADGHENDEPEVLILAGWNPALPTLLPVVDAVTLLSEVEGTKLVRGQADFANMVENLERTMQRVEGEREIYTARPLEDPGRLSFRLDRIPLGFTVGMAEMV